MAWLSRQQFSLLRARSSPTMLTVDGGRSVRSAWRDRLLKRKNFPEGIVRLRAALRYSPDHLEARRTIASLLEASRSPEALEHRQRLMDLQPQFVEPKLAYARSALLLDKPDEAAKVLDKFKGANRKSSHFLELRADLFLARGRPDLALEAYRELLELHPEDRPNQVKLTALQLQTGLEQDRKSARQTLESLSPTRNSD